MFRTFRWALDEAQTALTDEWIRDMLRARNVGPAKALVDSDKASGSDYADKMKAIAAGKYAVPAAASSSSTAVVAKSALLKFGTKEPLASAKDATKATAAQTSFLRFFAGKAKAI